MNANCQQCRSTIRLQFEGAITPEQGAEIKSHLGVCSACRAYAREMRAVAAGLEALASEWSKRAPDFGPGGPQP